MRDAGRRAGPGRPLALRGHPRRHPQLPAAAAPPGRGGRRRRPGAALRPRWSRSAPTRPCPTTPSRALVGPVSMPVRNHAWWEDDTFTHVGSLPGAARRGALGRSAARRHRRPDQPPGGRERRDADCGPGAPPRGHRLLGRQQVPLPRPVGPGDDRRDALARRADHQQRDHRHAGHHARCGRWWTRRPSWCPASATRCASSWTTTAAALESLAFGEPEEAWAAAADVAAETHVDVSRPPGPAGALA